jgi:membrane-bound inhibitor of C-type lysozyme
MTLAQTISADGGRYANFDESFVFWSKGNGALVLENDKEKSFVGCVVSAPATAGLPQAYSSGKMGFSIRLPKGYTAGQVEDEPSSLADPSTSFTAVQFTIPTSFVEGTNLGADTFIRVAEAKQTDTCSANSFLPDSVPAHVVTDGGVTYSVATVSDAAAGNRYDNTVYALPDSSPCLGIFYYIHYSVFENYPPGTVKKFDEPALIKQFDAIRRTLVTK